MLANFLQLFEILEVWPELNSVMSARLNRLSKLQLEFFYSQSSRLQQSQSQWPSAVCFGIHLLPNETLTGGMRATAFHH